MRSICIADRRSANLFLSPFDDPDDPDDDDDEAPLPERSDDEEEVEPNG